MTIDKDLEDLLRQVRLSTTAQQDERILGDALAVIDRPAVFSLRMSPRSVRRHRLLSTAAAGVLVLLVVLPLALPRTPVEDSPRVREVAAVTESPENPAPPTRGTEGGNTAHVAVAANGQPLKTPAGGTVAPGGGHTPHKEFGLAGSPKTLAGRARAVLRRERTAPNAPGRALQPKSRSAALVPADKSRNFGTQAPASRNTTLAAQPKQDSRAPVLSDTRPALARTLDLSIRSAPRSAAGKATALQTAATLPGSIKKASLIIRGKGTAVTATSIRYKVAKVLHGKLTIDVVTAAIPETPEKHLASRYPVGRDVIVFLKEPRETDEGVIWTAFRWFYEHSAMGRIDDQEAAILSAIANLQSPWGKAVEGVQVRLRTKQSKWNEGAVPRLWADVRNQGKRNLLVITQSNRCELEVDGRWYRRPVYTREIRLRPQPFPPGRQYDDIAVVVDEWWELPAPENARAPWETGPERLKLTPGKHTIRVAFTATAGKNAPGKPVRAVSNPVEIEIVATSDEKVDATQQANASVTVAEPTLDGKEILEKLKSIDAVYAASFTASGKRLGWPKKNWKLTMLDGEILYEEQVVEIPQPAKNRIGRGLAFRRTYYMGPRVQAEHNWVGRIRRYGPLDPWPENSAGPATACSLDVAEPIAGPYKLIINRPILCLGRGYSKYITDIKQVIKQEDGRLKITAEGTDIGLRPGATWELVADPDAEYIVRSAKLVDNRNRLSSFTNSGLRRHGSLCVPEKGECKGGHINATFELQSASFEADVEFLTRAKAAMKPPYLLHTDVTDQRRTPELYMPYDAGKMSPRGGKPDLDLDWEKEAAFDMEEVPVQSPMVRR